MHAHARHKFGKERFDRLNVVMCPLPFFFSRRTPARKGERIRRQVKRGRTTS